eukprot:c6133_g1_i1.p1 GENE.c6133_g1_i1~~c6133_g1_i1.p1  ORF type:complete len:486 (+),score=69.65 c6133_g1_i1:49-1506(+)
MDVAALTRINSVASDLLSQTQQTSKTRPLYEDFFGCVSRNFGKGFLLGAGVNGVVGFFNVTRGKESLVGSLTKFFESGDTSRWGIFAGLVLAVFNGTLYVITSSTPTESEEEVCETPLTVRQLITNKIQAIVSPSVRQNLYYYRAFIAGSLSGLAIFALPPQTRSTVAIFVTVRALEIQAKLAVRRHFIPEVPHADTLLMMASSAEVMWAWVFHRHSIARSYRTFLVRQAQLDPIQVEAVRRVQCGLPLELDTFNSFRLRKGFSAVTDPFMYEKAGGWAEIVHPGTNFLWNTTLFFFRSIRQSFGVYLPVYGFSMLMFSAHRCLASPFSSAKRMITDVIRSSLFLSAYCTSGIASMTLWRELGFTHSIMGSLSKAMVALAGATGGVMLLLEKPSRRLELALFVCRQSFHSLFVLMNTNPRFRSRGLDFVRSKLELLLFCLAMGHIMHAFVQHPQLVRYRALLSRFFDSEQRHNFFGDKNPHKHVE